MLIRRGGYAVGVARDGRLLRSKVGSRYVQSRTAAGGWSQQRFARRREGQARELVRRRRRHLGQPAGGPARPDGRGDRWRPATVRGGAGRAAARALRALGVSRHLDVPDPRLAVLQDAARRAMAAARRPSGSPDFRSPYPGPVEILRYVAFSTDPAGGNPAGVVLDATGADATAMQAVAAEVGYSETAFVLPQPDGELDVRYFSPLAEVPFCGHATIATAVAYAERHGVGELRLPHQGRSGRRRRTRRPGRHRGPPGQRRPHARSRSADGDLAELLAALRWSADDLDPSLPPRVAYAGAWHPVIAASTRARLAALDYDLAALGAHAAARTGPPSTWSGASRDTVFHARNPFPPGGVVEDPATGAAAAAFGGYLRELGLVSRRRR